MHPLKDLYKKHATDADIWLKKSKELYDSAELVWNHVSIENIPSGGTFINHKLGHPAQMLMGLSLECIVKGYILSKNPEHIKDGRLDKKIAIHKLADLFSMADIYLDEHNIALLNRLTENVVWLAKYSIPLAYQQKEIDIMNLAVDGNDFDQFRYLYQLVLEKIKTTA
ncbi:MAG: hypothetical protein KA163_15040 [Bacteroidia bacterium]|nr:hypothetical protein [Bacteroidia bacterium]